MAPGSLGGIYTTVEGLITKIYDKLEEAKEKVKQEAEQEIIKLIGNQILDIERKWLNVDNSYTYIKYNNESRDLLDRILTVLYYQAENQNRLNRNFELRFKKQLSGLTRAHTKFFTESIAEMLY